MADISGALTDYAELEVMEHIFHATNSYTATTVFIALHTANPTDAGTTNEISTTEYVDYVRGSITFAAVSSRATIGGAVSNFPQAGGGSTGATVTHYGVWDAATAATGNLLAYGELVTSRDISAGNTPSIGAGEIVLSMEAGGNASDYLTGAVLDMLFRNTGFTKPDTFVFFAITAALTDASTGTSITEPSGNGYAREEVTAWTTGTGTAENTGTITLGPPSGAWGALVATGTVDAVSSGNILYYDNAPGGDGQNPGNGDTVQFAAGAYTVTID